MGRLPILVVVGFALAHAGILPALAQQGPPQPSAPLRRVPAGTFVPTRLALQDPPQPENQEDMQPDDGMPVLEPPEDAPALPSPLEQELEEQIQAPETAPAPTTGGGLTTTPTAAERTQAVDTAQLLQQSESAPGVTLRRRSPVSLEPWIRGFHVGQIYTQADGAFYTPARQDLDTILSKIDPGSIQTATVIPGPYAARYGPGFAFIDILTTDTPRYDCFETHHRVSLSYRQNGAQWNGREVFYGGGSDWGFRFAYGNRNGVDYDSGNDTQIPANYKNQDFVAQIGRDFGRAKTLEVRYQRLDQSNTEYAGLFFDINFLTTDALTLEYVDDRPLIGSRVNLDGWYNNTRFGGDSLNASKRSFNVVNRVENALAATPLFVNEIDSPFSFMGATAGDTLTTGARSMVSFGDVDDSDYLSMSLGADVRFVTQRVYEFLSARATPRAMPPPPAVGQALMDLDNFTSDMPRSTMTDPGLFVETNLPMTRRLTVRIGGRADWVQTDVGRLREDTLLQGQQLDQSETLWGAYVVGDYEVNDVLTLRASGGQAQRPPTLTERYADNLFLGVAQSGFSRVVGQPDLRKERNWQVDVGFVADSDRVRLRGTAFYAWIEDYITFDASIITPGSPGPLGARRLFFLNTDRATLRGGELFAEWDLTSWLTPFGSASYVEGDDEIIDQPLPQIAPLEGRLGVRLHDKCGGDHWRIEVLARIVDNQDRFAFVRSGGVDMLEQLEEPTPGFTTFAVAGFFRLNESINITAGIDNLFDKNYIEHLDLRLPADDFGPNIAGDSLGETRVLSPGFTPYLGFEITR